MKRKKMVVIGIFFLTIATISSFTTIEDLENTMRAFNAALGVKCGHCHAPKSTGERGLDFASDANPKKDIARAMMKMTNKINKKYFKDNHSEDGALKQIGCGTCHNGQVEPQIRLVAHP
jgi:cytochrome c553